MIYLIETLQFLSEKNISNVQEFLNLENVQYRKYRLTSDLDFSSVSEYVSQPIYHEFNGDGHKISNIKIIYPNGKNYYGIFRQTNNEIKITNLHVYNVTIITQQTIESNTYASILIPYTQQLKIYNVSISDCSINIASSHQNLKAAIVNSYTNQNVVIQNLAVSNCLIKSQRGTQSGYITSIIGSVNGQVKIQNVYSQLTVSLPEIYNVNSVSGLIGSINQNENQSSLIQNVTCKLICDIPQGYTGTYHISGLIYSSTNQIKYDTIQNQIINVNSYQDIIAGIDYQPNINATYNNIYTQTDNKQKLCLTSDQSFAPTATNIFTSASNYGNYQQSNQNQDIVSKEMVFPTYEYYSIAEQTKNCPISDSEENICAKHAMCIQSQLGSIKTYYCNCNQYSIRYGNQCIKVKYEPQDTIQNNKITQQNQQFLALAIGGSAVLLSLILFNLSLMAFFKKRNIMKMNAKGGKSQEKQKQLQNTSSSSGSKALTDKAKTVQLPQLNLQQNQKVVRMPQQQNNVQQKQILKQETASMGTNQISLKSIQPGNTAQIFNNLNNYLPKIDSMPTSEVMKELNNPEQMLDSLYQPNKQNKQELNQNIMMPQGIKTDSASQINTSALNQGTQNNSSSKQENKGHGGKKSVKRMKKHSDKKKEIDPFQLMKL